MRIVCCASLLYCVASFGLSCVFSRADVTRGLSEDDGTISSRAAGYFISYIAIVSYVCFQVSSTLHPSPYSLSSTSGASVQ
jgi:hypothetical protein